MPSYDSQVTFQIDQSRYRLVANAVDGGIVLASIPGDRLFTVRKPAAGPSLPDRDDMRSLVKERRLTIIVPNPWPHHARAKRRASGRRA